MNQNIVGINSENLKKMILYIYECRDKISKILEDSRMIVESTKVYYNTDDGEEFRTKFQKFSSTFPTFLLNIKSYGEDLEKVLQLYKQNDMKSIDLFRKN